ncbi:UNVERIFIED_CONTAM: hypothetical protein GTU68_046829 [Idotea baltica]|nr:hypothetical protein [Idotea baltica]
MDANFFQHQPYLDEFNQSRGSNLVSIVPVHLEPFGAYSEKFKNISDIPDGAKVAIPNDATNGGRALLLLEKAGLIKLKDNTNILATPKDIIKNPKHIEIRELEAATLPRVLNQLDLALINTNYALDAGLDPIQDALIMEDIKSPYANRLVARADNKDDPAVQALAKALNSPDVKQFILTQYKDAIIPAF